MAIDTLAYAKTLEAAGVERGIAEAHAEAMAKFALPDLATKQDLDHAIERVVHQLTVRMFGLTLGIVGLMNAVLFALLRVVH